MTPDYQRAVARAGFVFEAALSETAALDEALATRLLDDAIDAAGGDDVARAAAMSDVKATAHRIHNMLEINGEH